MGPGTRGGLPSVDLSNQNDDELDLYGNIVIGWLVIGFKANCSPVEPGPVGGMPSVGDFLSDYPYLRQTS